MEKKSRHTEDIHIRVMPELRQAIERESKRLRVRPSTFIRMTLAERCAAEETLAEKEQEKS
jgi:hypothetical protein